MTSFSWRQTIPSRHMLLLFWSTFINIVFICRFIYSLLMETCSLKCLSISSKSNVRKIPVIPTWVFLFFLSFLLIVSMEISIALKNTLYQTYNQFTIPGVTFKSIRLREDWKKIWSIETAPTRKSAAVKLSNKMLVFLNSLLYLTAITIRRSKLRTVKGQLEW